MKPKILLAGLGETGTELLKRLCRDWDVIAVDPDEEALARVAALDLSDADITLHRGDATSSLVLKKTGVEAVHAAVATAGSDEVNHEFLRVAHDRFEVNNLFGLMYSLDWEDRYRESGIERISQDHACAAILEARVQRGQKVATGVGLGEGEIVEVEVLPNSSVIGRPLAELRTVRWLVGAVYRERKLIVPHGDTILRAGDRVLLIGDPEILPSIATLVRTGESEFPLKYGSQVVSILKDEPPEVLEETAYLIANTRAERLEAIACDADEGRGAELVAACEEHGVPCELSCQAASSLESLAAATRRRDVGVLILPHEPLGFLGRIGLKRSRTARVLDAVDSPVLVSRKTFPYRKVLIALAELPFHTAAAQLAIDVARMVEGELHLGVVHQPEIVAGADLREEMVRRRKEIENLAGMYHVELERRVFEGNPIRELIAASTDYDLLVLPYTRGRSAFLTRPDVGLNLIHRVACSVLAMPC